MQETPAHTGVSCCFSVKCLIERDGLGLVWAELVVFGESVKEQIASFPGLREWGLVANVETGRAVSFSTFEHEAAFLESKAEIDSILSALG